MNTTDLCSIIKQDMPETRNNPQLMNSLIFLLNELDKAVLRVNELGSENKLIVDLKIEKK